MMGGSSNRTCPIPVPEKHMAAAPLNWTLIPVTLAALAVGTLVGVIFGRRTALPPPDPPPVTMVMPLHDAARGEVLVMKSKSGIREEYSVVEASPESVLLEIVEVPVTGPTMKKQWRVTRTWLGVFQVLEADLDPVLPITALRDLVVNRVVQEKREVLGRTLDCWRMEATHRVMGDIKVWYSDQIAVHGIVRMETLRDSMDVVSSTFPQ
jgi:hypothetical protein